MELQGLVIISGTLALAIGLVTGGFFVGGGWGATMVAAGVVLAIVWVIGVFDIASAMNSDH